MRERTWRLWSSEIGGVLGGNQSGWRRDGSWDSIDWLSCNCGNVENWVQHGLPRDERLAGSGRQLIWEWCSTRCMQYLVYAVLGVNSWSLHGEIERDNLTSYSSVIVELRTRKRDERRCGKSSWETGTYRILCASQFTIPNTAVTSSDPACNYTNTRSSNQIRQVNPLISHICSYPPHHSHLPHPSLSFSSPIQPSLQNTKLSHPSLSLHPIIMSWHRVQHTPSTALTEYSIHPRLFVFPSHWWFQVDPWMLLQLLAYLPIWSTATS